MTPEETIESVLANPMTSAPYASLAHALRIALKNLGCEGLGGRDPDWRWLTCLEWGEPSDYCQYCETKAAIDAVFLGSANVADKAIHRPDQSAKIGDVFQITEINGRKGWIGAFVLATKIQTWGIQGFVCHVESRDQQNHAYTRLEWSELDYIGHTDLIPADEGPEGGA